MARPVDPRLWRYARTARPYLVVSVGLSLVVTVCIVVAALALARVLAGVITDPGRRTLGSWAAELTVFALAVACRAAATWWQARLAHRAGAQVVAELEGSVLAAAAELEPRELDSRRTELAVVVGNGLSGLRAYLTGYLPALLLAVLVPPIVLAVIAFHDLTAGAIILVTLPLIPLFMVLIGLMTQGRAAATLEATTRLSDQLLDLFAGMPTLRALGRETSTAAAGSGHGGSRCRDDRPLAPGLSGNGADAHPDEFRRTQRDRVRALGESLHTRTMAALRVAFLSSMVLELLATLCVALVAVSIGMRLVYGHMSLYAGLLGLILAPEVYLPLRAVGERFHAAQDGMAAAAKAFAILEPARQRRVAGQSGLPERAVGHSGLPERAAGQSGVPEWTAGQSGLPERAAGQSGLPERAARRSGLSERAAGHSGLPERAAGQSGLPERAAGQSGLSGRVLGHSELSECRGVIGIRDLVVRGRDGDAPDGLSAVLRPGEVTVLTGPNGCGKSTVLQAILGLIEPDRGTVTVDGMPVPELDPERWWSQLAWLPQRPVLLPGTLRENLELFGARAETPSAGPVRVLGDLEAACAATGFDAVLDELPERWDTLVGTGGLGLSLGQRQRLALTRVLASDRPVLLLDEPTAHLDAAAEATVLAALSARARAGATVVVVAHRPTLLAAADRVVEVAASHLADAFDPGSGRVEQTGCTTAESDETGNAASRPEGDGRHLGAAFVPAGEGLMDAARTTGAGHEDRVRR